MGYLRDVLSAWTPAPGEGSGIASNRHGRICLCTTSRCRSLDGESASTSWHPGAGHATSTLHA